MQVLAGVISFIILLVAGIVGIIISIAGLIISRVMRKSGRKYAKAVKVISIVWMIGSIILTAIPTSFFGFIFYINSKLPEGYVDTDIIIEGDIYQNDYFTADGKVYRLLDLDAYYDGCKEKATPVFSYKPEGILNRAQWQNYYRIETEPGFDLIWNGEGSLFCTDEEREKIVDYYTQSDLKWVYSDWNDYDEGELHLMHPLPADAAEAMNLYLSIDTKTLPETVFTLDDYDKLIITDITVEGISKDEVVCAHYFSFTLSEDGAYKEKLIHTNSDGVREVIAVRLPDNIGISLSKLAAKE